MKKYAFLFTTTLLFILACKKEQAPSSANTDLFKDVVSTDHKDAIEFKMDEWSDIAYLGYITSANNTLNYFLNPLIGVEITNSEIYLKDINNSVIKKQAINNLRLSNYRENYNTIIRNTNNLLSPKISYKLYTPVDLSTASKTTITLVMKATYFYMDLNPVMDENLKLYNDIRIDQVKETGAYLSRIGYGLSFVYEITSDIDPKVYIPALEAYLKDQLNNKGEKANELKKYFTIINPKTTYLGGPITEWFSYSDISPLDRIGSIIKGHFIPKVQKSFGKVEFEFRSLKDGKIVK